MTLRLKDKELQKKLDEISNGDFSRALKENLFARPNSPIDCKVTYRVSFGEPPDAFANRFSAVFRDDEVEDVPEYDPNSWNNWPEVTPPECVLMRVEFDFVEEDLDGDPLRTVRVYESGLYHGGHWFNANGDAELFCESFDEERVSNFRYRPWED